MSRLAAWLCALLALGLAPGVRAEAFRTLVMVDASSSMRRTDPQKLRKVAAELYVDLAREGDFVSVWQFHGEPRPISEGFVQIRSGADRDRLKDAVRAIGDDGDWTDFGAAFEAAAKAFAEVPPTPGEKRFLVFLTDGRCEPAPENPLYLKEGAKPDRSKRARDGREERCKQLVLSEALPRLEGVETVAVGLSRSAPREFLEELARRSHGRASVTEKAADLPHLFAAIHAQNAGARVARARGAKVVVDRFASELDLVVCTDRGVELELFDPAGAPVALDAPGVDYVRHESYRFFRLPKPAAGEWTVKPSRRLDDAVFAAIQSFDLRLQVEAPAQVAVGSPVELKVVLAAGDGGGMPEEGFLARHRFLVEATVDGKSRTLELIKGEGGARLGKVATVAPGSIELRARVEPGPDGALTRLAAPVTVLAVPPLELVAAPISLGTLKPGESFEAKLDLSGSKLLGEVELALEPEGLPFEIDPGKVMLKADRTSFELEFELPEEAAPGQVEARIRLVPKTAPYEGRPGGEVAIRATIRPLTFWEAHGGKTTTGLVLLLLGVVIAGFKTPARFPRKLRVFYVDKPNDDEGDFGLALRGKPGFYRPGCFRFGGGGPVRRSSALLLELIAADGGVLVRPARGRTITAGGESFSRPFRPVYGTRYEIEEGFVFWIGKEDEDG